MLQVVGRIFIEWLAVAGARYLHRLLIWYSLPTKQLDCKGLCFLFCLGVS